MNTHTLAQRAYSTNSAPTKTHRGTEYDVFARITHGLKSAALDRTQNFSAFSSAVHDNRQLWSLLAADVADADNMLPKDLRARIFYLAEFTFGHSSKVLNSDASVAPLLEINTAIMRGLKQQAAVS